MSCLSVTIAKVSGLGAYASLSSPVECRVEKVGGLGVALATEALFAGLSVIGDVKAGLGYDGGLSMAAARIGDTKAGLSPCEGLSFGIDREGNLIASAVNASSGIEPSAMKDSGLSARLDRICATDVTIPYLEIEPQIVWVVDGGASNDVYSNTNWNID